MPTYGRDAQGNYWEDRGNGYGRQVSPEEALQGSKSPLESFGESIGLSAVSAYKGAQQLLGVPGAEQDLAIARNLQAGNSRQNPVSSFAGEVVPAGLVAAGTAGMGVPAMIGTEAAMGAAYAPENPLLGAGIGAGAAGLGAAAPMALRALGRAGDIPGIPNMGRASMTDRVLATAEGQAPRGRVLEGHLTNQELDALQVPLSNSNRIKLAAETPEQYLQGRTAAWAEGIRGGTEDIAMQQRQRLTDIIKSEAGIEGPGALTGSVVGDAFERSGKIIGDFRKANGPLRLGSDQLERIAAVSDNALSGASSDFKRVVGDIEKSMGKTGGAIDPADANQIMTRLGNMSRPGGEYGTISGAKQILEEFNIALNANRNAAEQLAYQQAMKQYGLLKTLNKTGVVGKDALINPQSFSTQWKNRSSLKGQGKDDIGRLANTFATLAYKDVHTGNTLQRVFANAPGVLQRNAPAAVGGALGAGGLGWASGLLGH